MHVMGFELLGSKRRVSLEERAEDADVVGVEIELEWILIVEGYILLRGLVLAYKHW